MRLTEEQLETLETPCIVIDVNQVRQNVRAMQAAVDEAGCALRPHIKTHKMAYFARMQLEAGASGITCAKVSEAEAMADGGIGDIFIAYPQIGSFRIKRCVELAKRVKRLIVGVDTREGAVRLNEEAMRSGTVIEVRLEIDTGSGRTGVPLSDAAALAEEIAGMDGLRLTGIYTFKGLIYKGETTDDNALAAAEEGELLEQAANALAEAGVNVTEISGGSSPTGVEAARTGKLTEVRPGTYIFKDQLLCCEHVAEPEEIAVRFAVTVVSTSHDSYAVIDGGSKTFPSDIALNAPPFYYKGYAAVEGRPDLTLSRMNEEHGIVTAAGGKTGLKVGDKLILVPIHVCTAVNMHNYVYLLDGEIIEKMKVDARGMVV
ncbi:MAG: alanine racemase [Clostridiaceae bacterium]|nr:alanine racemase [Clostridiaceae bacterium]